ncbi:MAG: hypothetical protein HY812_19780 [Planctomycetes bacterium]|nr:hypothetical protein [Planctomycetota bacterium]
MLTYPAFGIELSDGALKAVKVQRRGARLVVTRAEYRPYARAEDGAVRPRAGLDARAREALKQFLAEARPGRLDRIYVGLPSVATFNRLIMVPNVGEERLREIARYEAHRSLRGAIDDYVVRTRVLGPRRQQAEVPCLLFAVRKDLRDAFVSDLAALGLEFDNMLPSPAALALFVRYDRPASGDRVAVSIGLQATEIVYLRERGHAFRTLPLGVVGLQGRSGAAGGALRPVARRLVERIAGEIGKGARFFFHGQGGFDPQVITLFGEGAAIPEVVDEFRGFFPAKVESIDSLHRMHVDRTVPDEARAYVPQMGCALGLAIAAARAEDPQIELLDRNRSRDAARRFPGLGVATLLVSLAAFLAAERDIAEAGRIAALHVTPAAEDVRAQSAEELRLAAESEQLLAQERGLERMARSRAARAALLSRVVRNFGPDVAEYGAVDLRLVECRLERTGDGAEVSGRTLAPLLDLRVATILRQRLALGAGLRDVAVEEIEAERDEFEETTVYSFRGRIAQGGTP